MAVIDCLVNGVMVMEHDLEPTTDPTGTIMARPQAGYQPRVHFDLKPESGRRRRTSETEHMLTFQSYFLTINEEGI